ncbi:Signal recognition particle receptor FtsY [subsurface metagenome]
MLQKKGWGSRLKDLFNIRNYDQAFFEELEELLIEGDIGLKATAAVIDELKERVFKEKLKNRLEILAVLKDLLGAKLLTHSLVPETGKLNIFLVLGVNGVGKTTTIAKLADFYRRNNGIRRIILSAGDTFRAAAIDQLCEWAKRLELPVIRQSHGADPGAVIFDSIDSARAGEAQLVLADTAGRLHNKAHLVKELGKIDKIIRSRIGDGNYKKLLVLDATTGQNALRQTEVFHEAIGVDSIILAKFDSTARGGIVIAICQDLGLPFSFTGTGEKLPDIHPFDKESYLESLLDKQ